MFGHLLTPRKRLFVEELSSNTRDKGAYMKSVLILLDIDKGYDEMRQFWTFAVVRSATTYVKKFLRKKALNPKFYPTFEEFRRAILAFFENINGYKEELQSLITFNFQRLNKPRLALELFKTALFWLYDEDFIFN